MSTQLHREERQPRALPTAPLRGPHGENQHSTSVQLLPLPGGQYCSPFRGSTAQRLAHLGMTGGLLRCVKLETFSMDKNKFMPWLQAISAPSDSTHSQTLHFQASCISSNSFQKPGISEPAAITLPMRRSRCMSIVMEFSMREDTSCPLTPAQSSVLSTDLQALQKCPSAALLTPAPPQG